MEPGAARVAGSQFGPSIASEIKAHTTQTRQLKDNYSFQKVQPGMKVSAQKMFHTHIQVPVSELV